MKQIIAITICCGAIYAANGLQSESVDAGHARVSGRVTYADGSPVVNATVEVRAFAAYEGIWPDPVHTDKNGRYVLSYPALGGGFIGASKPEEGYPNPLIALFNLRYYSGLREINLAPAGDFDEFDLKLQAPRPVLVFKVLDSVTDEPITNARLYAAWPDDANIMTSVTIPSSGISILDLPEHPIVVKISAPGHEEWYWTKDRQERDTAGAEPRSRISIEVRLKPT